MRKIWVNNIPIDGGKPTTTSIVWTINPIVVYDYWPPPVRALWYTIDVDHIIKWYVMFALTIYMCEIIKHVKTSMLSNCWLVNCLCMRTAFDSKKNGMPPTPPPHPPTPPPTPEFWKWYFTDVVDTFQKKKNNNSFYRGNCFVVYIQPPYIPGPCFN